ncbi:MAG: DUF937 domain-containing protein [Rhodomicrobium sp.]
MSTNLVSAIMQALSPEVIGKIASSLGIDQTAAQKGISAGIPGVLAGLANAASNPAGAQRLGSVVSQIQDMPSQDIVKNLLEADHAKVAESGWSMISSLMGSNTLQTLASAVAQFAGFRQGMAKTLLGLIAPLVLGFLRREQLTQGLDSRGLASMLASQRDNIRRVMPSGVAQSLLDSTPQPANEPVAPEAFRRRATSPAQSPSSGSRLFWLVPALILAGLAIYLLPIKEETRTAEDSNNKTSTVSKTTAATEPAPAPVVPVTTASEATRVSLENDIVANIARLRASLQTIKDPATAKAALAEMKDISAQFGRLKGIAQQLPPEARKTLAAAVATRVPDLNGLIDRLGSQTDFGGEAKPAMDSLKSQLVGITKA